jgi:radical SAM superfamily enzyme YgiQ (UPF0313 family)
MKIVFINPPIPELADDRLEPPLGILSVASYLQCYGIDVEIVDLSGGVDINIPAADFYGFYTCTSSYHRAMAISKQVNGLTIAGGPHASALPKEVAKNFDFVVVGEGEVATLNIVRGKTTECIVQGMPVEKLDNLPFIDYSLIDMATYHRTVDGEKSFPMLSSRGCPYSCAFCNSIIMGRNHKTRLRSPEHVIAEMKMLIDKYGVSHFRFHDDIFGMDKKWLVQFTDMVKDLDIVYRAFVRADQCAKDGFTDLLYDGGCRLVAIGIESGSDEMLGRMDKRVTREICFSGIRKAKESGLTVRSYFIVGFPGETWETISDTVDFIKIAQPDEYMVYSFIPYPGTPVYHHPERYGIKQLSTNFNDYFFIYGDRESKYIYETDTLTAGVIKEMREYIIAEADRLQLSWASKKEGQHDEN